MKMFIAALFLVTTTAFAAPDRILPVTKESEALKADKLAKDKAAKEKLKMLDKKSAEDCDDKAKKPIEIKPESISLSGTAGCSVDEAH
jgi:hypothetical protein